MKINVFFSKLYFPDLRILPGLNIYIYIDFFLIFSHNHKKGSMSVTLLIHLFGQDRVFQWLSIYSLQRMTLIDFGVSFTSLLAPPAGHISK